MKLTSPKRANVSTSSGNGSAGRDVIVIGAGFGGLAAAIRLAARGYQVTVLESRDQPGGRAGRIRDQGFTFDTGPTLITVPELFRDLWRTAGRSFDEDVVLQPLEPFYEIRFRDGRDFRYSGEQDTFEQEIRAFNPADVDGYRRFIEASGNIYQRAFADLGRVPFHSLRQFMRVVPELVRLGGLSSVHDFVSRYVSDPHLRTVLSFHPLFIGGNPYRASAIYSIVPYLERQSGVHFASGGMHEVVLAMVRLLRELGGEILYGHRVRRITSAAGRVTGVTCADGTAMSADLIVANSDAAATSLELIDGKDRSALWSSHLTRARYSMSCLLFYFGLDRQYPSLAHHTILMPRDVRVAVTDIFDRGRVPADLPMYLHTPTRTDPSMAPPGGESLYALVPVPNLSSQIDWKSTGDSVRARVVESLERDAGLRGFADAIVVEHRYTPDYFRDDLGSWLGAAFSIEPTLSQSAYFRPHNKSGRLDGLYFVGAGTHPGAGVPGVLLSAEISTNMIIGEPVRRKHRDVVRTEVKVN